MGCKGSKLDEQEAVALCRGRADLLAAAVRHRYALADAHDALADSLASVAAALHLLMTAPGQQRLALPAARKDVDAPPAPAPAAAAAASSPPHSSSHINFAPSSDSESGSVTSSPPHRRRLAAGYDQLPQHHPLSLPLPYPHYGYGYAPEPFPYGGGYPQPPGSLRLYYARSRPPPASVAVVEQRTAASERVYYGSVEPTAGGDTRYYSYGGGEPAGRATAPTPPPPSPPRTTSWDFFNVFGDYDVYDNYCYDAGGGAGGATSAAYTPSRSSREVREEEGIPDLEDDDAVVKQVAGEFSAPGSGARSRRSSLGGVSSSIAEVDEEENSVVDKEVIGAPAPRNTAASAPTPRRPVDTTDVAGEIKAQFIRAADAVRALSPLLEVGRRRYHHRSSVYHGERFLPVLSTSLEQLMPNSFI